ncbi:MAG: MipA/OmpV family protein [Planctomycetota bacterium]|jgi:outer membrane protein
MTRLNTAIATILINAFLATGLPGAEGEPQAETGKPDVFVGIGAVISGKPYEGVDPKVYPVPLFGYEGERLYLRGISGGYRLIKMKRWSIGPTVRPRFEGYEASDSSALSGMEDRNPTVDGGIDLAWMTDWGLFSTIVVTDLLGAHDGHELEASYTLRFPYAGFEIFPSLAVRWRSSNLVQYYYGVRGSEARAGRPAYKPDAAITPAVRLALRRDLSDKWGTFLAAQYEWLDNEISDSPIVDDTSRLSLVLGVTYAF